jgi:hypothetical protein
MLKAFALKFSLVSTLLSCCWIYDNIAANAQGWGTMQSPGMLCTGMGRNPIADEFTDRAFSDLAISANPLAGIVEIAGVVKYKQCPEQVSIKQSSGVAQFDAECLQAVLDTVRTDDNETGVLYGYWSFNAKSKVRYPFQVTPKANSVELFRIPLSVLKRYPGMFESQELLNEKNLKRITIASTLTADQVKQLSEHYANWSDFFRQHEKPTKEQILRKAASLEEDESKGETKTDLSLRQH